MTVVFGKSKMDMKIKVMKEIKLYLDLEKIEKETGRKFDVEGEYSDNFLQ